MSINKVILIGNVGKDPEVRYLDNGGVVANFSIATTEKGYTTSNGAQVPSRTEWHNVVLWKGLAEIAEKYIHKGSKIFIEGKIRTRSYDDQHGVVRHVTEIWGSNIELLDKKVDSTSKFSSNESNTTTNSIQKTIVDHPIESDEDDLPF